GLPWAASRHPRDGAVPHVRSVPTRRSSDLAWYFRGYAVGGELRAALAQSSSLAEIDELLGRLDHDQPYPGADAEGQRGRAGTPKQPALPEHWLESRELHDTHRTQLTEGEGDTSGG